MKACNALLSLLVSTLVMSVYAFGAVAQHKTVATDTIPSISGYKANPYTYRYGNVEEVEITRNSGKLYTEMYFKPVGTYLLYSEHVIFCGDHRQKLDFNTGDVVVLIHSRLMHHKDCYDLLRIDVIKKARTAGQP